MSCGFAPRMVARDTQMAHRARTGNCHRHVGTLAVTSRQANDVQPMQSPQALWDQPRAAPLCNGCATG